MNSLMKRASVRKYSEKPVEDKLLYKLLEEAEHTQTMGNLQLYSVVVSRDDKMKKRLAPLHFNQPMVMEAPVVLTFCADYHRTTEWCMQRKAHPGYGNFLSLMNAVSDVLLYLQTFCNLAEEAGLGLCYLGTTIYNAGQIIDTLQLPRLVLPVGTITLGWPAEQPTISERLPLKAIVHQETYKDYTPELIDQFYTEKECMAENRRFVEINQKETLAQIFTDIRYTKSDCEAISKALLVTLHNQGFM